MFSFCCHLNNCFPGGACGKRTCLPMQKTQEMQVQSLSQKDPLEEDLATHSSILPWRILWTEETDRLQSIQSQSDMTEAT